MRTAVEVDRAVLEREIATAESDGPLPNRSRLHEIVAEKIGVTPVVVYLRIKNWNLVVKTPVSRLRGGEKKAPAAEKPLAEKKAPAPAAKTAEIKPVEPIRQRLMYSSDGLNRLLSIHTPAGKCPVKWIGNSYEEVRTWALAVKEQGAMDGRHYTGRALCHFARQTIDINTPEYREVAAHIQMFAMDDDELSV